VQPRSIRIRLFNPPGEAAKDVDLTFTNVTPVVFDVAGSYGVGGGLQGLPEPEFKVHLAPGRRVTRIQAVATPGVYEADVRWRNSNGKVFLASATVFFAGKEVDAEVITVPPNGLLSCSIVFANSNGSHPMPDTLVTLNSRSKGSAGCGSGPDGSLQPPHVEREGVYDIDRITHSGETDLFTGLRWNDLYVSSAREGNRDVLAEGFELNKTESRLELIIREGAGLVQGTVTNRQGASLQDAKVVLIPEPSARGIVVPIAYREGRTDQNGSFELRGV